MKAILLIAVLLCIALQGCSDLGEPIADGPLELNETVDGKTLMYAPHQKFALSLESSICAGLQWGYVLSDSNVTTVEGEVAYIGNSGPGVGGPAIATVHFRTGQTGECLIHMFEHLPWDLAVPPAKTVTFRVFVRR